MAGVPRRAGSTRNPACTTLNLIARLGRVGTKKERAGSTGALEIGIWRNPQALLSPWAGSVAGAGSLAAAFGAFALRAWEDFRPLDFL